MRRAYKSGSRWAFWRWTEVETEYITRLHIVKTPWFAICLHWIHKPDPDPYLHDHPVSFLSVILRGGYSEVRVLPVGGWTYGWNWFWNYIRATDVHRIERVKPGTLTLCFMGPKAQEWGFYTPRGRIMWKDYYKMKSEGLV